MTNHVLLNKVNMSKAIQLVQTFGLSTQQIEEFAKNVATPVLDGEEDALLVLANLKAMETIAERVKAMIGNEITDALDMYPEKTFLKGGVQFTKGSRKTYNYKDNEEWAGLDKKRKDLEKQLKAMTKPMADPDSGEIISPPSFKTSEYVSIKLKP